MARVAERIQQNRAREHERYKAQRVHGIHPSMIPKPTSEPDRLEPILAAIERGEDPFPDDPVRSAYVVHGADLYSPVNSDAPSLPRERSERGEGGSPERSEGETGGGIICCSEHAAPPDSGGLYYPVNSGDGAGEEEPAEAYRASSGAVSKAAAVSGFPSPRAERGGGEGSGVGGDVCSEQKIVPPPGAADAAPPSPPLASAREGRDGASVSLGDSSARTAAAAAEGSVAALGAADGGREPLYVNPG
jgi:hypothetical protein